MVLPGVKQFRVECHGSVTYADNSIMSMCTIAVVQKSASRVEEIATRQWNQGDSHQDRCGFRRQITGPADLKGQMI